MNITIIGTGNVATVLGKVFLQNGHSIIQVVGRREEAVKELADILRCPYSLNLKEINQSSDLYIIAVSDKAIEEIINKIIIPNESMIVHTAGGVSMNIFRNKFDNYGVLYPLQSLRKENKYLPEIPFYIDGNTNVTKSKLIEFAKTVSPIVNLADDDQRIKLHVAAVFTSNFPNFLYAVADDFCQKEHINFNDLLPLIRETTNRLKYFSPAETQTGPAVRNDTHTINKHITLLHNNPEAEQIYKYLSEKIAFYFSSKHSSDNNPE